MRTKRKVQSKFRKSKERSIENISASHDHMKLKSVAKAAKTIKTRVVLKIARKIKVLRSLIDSCDVKDSIDNNIEKLSHQLTVLKGLDHSDFARRVVTSDRDTIDCTIENQSTNSISEDIKKLFMNHKIMKMVMKTLDDR